jgi:hypothetical protein
LQKAVEFCFLSEGLLQAGLYYRNFFIEELKESFNAGYILRRRQRSHRLNAPYICQFGQDTAGLRHVSGPQKRHGEQKQIIPF